MGGFQRFVARQLALKPPIYGAYTELFSALSNDVEVKDGWAWVVPWGKTDKPRSDVAQECRSGGTADQFWEWSERQVENYT